MATTARGDREKKKPASPPTPKNLHNKLEEMKQFLKAHPVPGNLLNYLK